MHRDFLKRPARIAFLVGRYIRNSPISQRPVHISKIMHVRCRWYMLMCHGSIMCIVDQSRPEAVEVELYAKYLAAVKTPIAKLKHKLMFHIKTRPRAGCMAKRDLQCTIMYRQDDHQPLHPAPCEVSKYVSSCLCQCLSAISIT